MGFLLAVPNAALQRGATKAAWKCRYQWVMLSRGYFDLQRPGLQPLEL